VFIQLENEGRLHRQHKQNAGRGEIKHRGGFRNSGVCPGLGVKLGGGEVMHILSRLSLVYLLLLFLYIYSFRKILCFSQKCFIFHAYFYTFFEKFAKMARF
jgi:hypothetical protein